MPEQEHLLNSWEAIDFVNRFLSIPITTRQALYGAIKRGKLKAEKRGREWRFRKADLLAWCREEVHRRTEEETKARVRRYMRNRARRLYKERGSYPYVKMGICKQCGRKRRHHAKGLCEPCYRRELRQRKQSKEQEH